MEVWTIDGEGNPDNNVDESILFFIVSVLLTFYFFHYALNY